MCINVMYRHVCCVQTFQTCKRCYCMRAYSSRQWVSIKGLDQYYCRLCSLQTSISQPPLTGGSRNPWLYSGFLSENHKHWFTHTTHFTQYIPLFLGGLQVNLVFFYCRKNTIMCSHSSKLTWAYFCIQKGIITSVINLTACKKVQ